MDDGIISVRGATKRFADLTAVDDLNLEVAAAEIFILVGPDGAGKTTTLRLLTGLVEPDAGDIRVAGHAVGGRGAALHDVVGYMAGRFGLYLDLTVEENMTFYADLFGISATDRKTRGAELLEMTRMKPFRNRRAGQLSGGMKQKLALICTLLHRPEILFLDEPTTGVDPASRREFWAILYRLVQEGLTVFVTTAYMDEAERANRVGLLYRGRLIRCDRPEALKQSMTEQGFRVEGAPLGRARRLFEAAEGVVSVTPFGKMLHLFIAPEQTSAERLLQQTGLGDSRSVTLTPLTPSLEDVFVTEVGKAARNRGES